MKTIFLAFNILFLLAVNFTSAQAQNQSPAEQWSQQLANVCVSETSNTATLECLNKNLEGLMRGPVNQHFTTKLNELLERENIQSLNVNQLGSLYDLYPVSTPTNDGFAHARHCVDTNGQMTQFKKSKVQQLARVLVETALFASRFATYALGQPFSPVLKFKPIYICESSTRTLRLNREDRSLEVGFRFVGATDKALNMIRPVVDFNAAMLWEEWQKGNALNPRPEKERGFINQTFEKTNYIGLSESQKIDEALFQKWQYLNPTGELRRNIRFTAWKLIDHLNGKINNQGAMAFLNAQLALLPEKIQAKAQNLSLLQKENLVQKMIARLKNPSFVQTALAKHIAMSAQSCPSSTTTITERDLKGTVVVANAKNINVNVDFNFPFGAYDDVTQSVYSTPDRDCSEARVENRDKSEAFVNINLVDNVNVTVLGLSRLTDAIFLMPQMILIEQLQN